MTAAVALLMLALAAIPNRCSAAWQSYSAITYYGAQWMRLPQPLNMSTAFVMDPVSLHKGMMNMGDRVLYQHAMCEVGPIPST